MLFIQAVGGEMRVRALVRCKLSALAGSIEKTKVLVCIFSYVIIDVFSAAHSKRVEAQRAVRVRSLAHAVCSLLSQASRGTVKTSANFNSSADADVLHKAMKGLGKPSVCRRQSHLIFCGRWGVSVCTTTPTSQWEDDLNVVPLKTIAAVIPGCLCAAPPRPRS